MHNIKGAGVLRKVMEILDKNIFAQLLEEQDIDGDNVYERAIKKGWGAEQSTSDQKERMYAAKRWMVLEEYRDVNK